MPSGASPHFCALPCRPRFITHVEVVLPPANNSGTVHVILQVEDDGTPHLFAYRRVIIRTTP